jgi:hypothetical protein
MTFEDSKSFRLAGSIPDVFTRNLDLDWADLRDFLVPLPPHEPCGVSCVLGLGS